MNSQLEELIKQSLELSGSVFKQMAPVMERLGGSYGIGGSCGIGGSYGIGGLHNEKSGSVLGPGFFNDLYQLNQLTLSTLTLVRNWEKALEGLRLFLSSFAGGSMPNDDRYQEMEEKIAGLKKRLDSQEHLIEKLQSKLEPETGSDVERGDAAQTLSDFLTQQSDLFQRLMKGNIG